jgi:GntR family transcriptional repressor for pyruvate dehydrogenase complex
MITFSARDRARIVAIHTQIADAIEAQDGSAAGSALSALEAETQSLAQSVFLARAQTAQST